MKAQFNHLACILLGFGVHTCFFERLSRHIERCAGQNTVSCRFAQMASARERFGIGQSGDGGFHFGNNHPIRVARGALGDLHALFVPIFRRFEHNGNVLEAVDQHKVEISAQETCFGLDPGPDGFVNGRPVDAFQQFIRPVDAGIAQAPVGEYHRVFGRHVVESHAGRIVIISFVTDVGA